jgi:hypothetical protein
LQDGFRNAVGIFQDIFIGKGRTDRGDNTLIAVTMALRLKADVPWY